MASTPRLKVFDADGTYQAACHDYAAAALLMSLYGDGATIRLGHSKRETVWTEGVDGNGAESYDAVGDAIAAEDARREAQFRAVAAR